MRKAFKYRLYPTRQQDAAMSTMRETHRRLCNDALAERKQAWERAQRSVSYGEQSGQLKHARTANPFLAATNFSSCQATLRRLDKAFLAFFRRMKARETPGYPRFKGRNRFDTVEFPSYSDRAFRTERAPMGGACPEKLSALADSVITRTAPVSAGPRTGRSAGPGR